MKRGQAYIPGVMEMFVICGLGQTQEAAVLLCKLSVLGPHNTSREPRG